jgi:hypothetical protein
MELLQLIRIQYSRLPQWAKVVTFFIVLLLNIYFLVTPRFVNGQVVAKTPDGGFVPYRGIELQTYSDGRTMKYRSNEDGYWSIPLVSRLPASLRIQVHIKDEHHWREVTINASDIWSTPWSNEFRLTITEKPSGLQLERVATSSHGLEMKSLASVFAGLVSASHAAGLTLPPAVKESGDANAIADKQRLDREIAQSFASITGKSASGNLARTAIGDESGLKYVQRIQLVQAIERSQNLKIPDEHWKPFTTLRELSDYVYRRKLLERHDPSAYRIKNAYDWANRSANLPDEQRARYR